MHKSYVGVIGIIVRIISQMPGNSVYQCSGVVAASGMYDHSGWLVDDQNVIVFEYDVQRNVLRYDVAFVLGPSHEDGYLVGRFDLITAFDRFAVDAYPTGFSRFLQSVA